MARAFCTGRPQPLHQRVHRFRHRPHRDRRRDDLARHDHGAGSAEQLDGEVHQVILVAVFALARELLQQFEIDLDAELAEVGRVDVELHRTHAIDLAAKRLRCQLGEIIDIDALQLDLDPDVSRIAVRLVQLVRKLPVVAHALHLAKRVPPRPRTGVTIISILCFGQGNAQQGAPQAHEGKQRDHSRVADNRRQRADAADQQQ